MEGDDPQACAEASILADALAPRGSPDRGISTRMRSRARARPRDCRDRSVRRWGVSRLKNYSRLLLLLFDTFSINPDVRTSRLRV